MANIGAFKNLKIIILDKSSIADGAMQNLESLRHLHTLQVSNTGISDSSLPAIARLTKLTNLNIRNTRISVDGIIKCLKSLVNLKALQVAVKHLNSNPDRFAGKLPDEHVLVSLEQIVLKCMQKDPAQRYQSIADVIQDLNAVKTGRAVGYEKSPDEEEPKQKGWLLMVVLDPAFATNKQTNKQ